MTWKPHVTVAAVARDDDRFLMVEELSRGKVVLNQPAGHLDEGESLVDAVVRETLEETAWTFHPEHIVGLYLWRHPHNGTTFLRVNFTGHCSEHRAQQALDEGIIRAVWMTRSELQAQSARLRSPMVMRCIDDSLRGQRYPLELLTDWLDEEGLQLAR